MLDGLRGDGEAPLRVLTIGSTGAMGGGQYGTALSAIIAAHHADRPVEALVAETRPGFEGRGSPPGSSTRPAYRTR